MMVGGTDFYLEHMTEHFLRPGQLKDCWLSCDISDNWIWFSLLSRILLLGSLQRIPVLGWKTVPTAPLPPTAIDIIIIQKETQKYSKNESWGRRLTRDHKISNIKSSIKGNTKRKFHVQETITPVTVWEKNIMNWSAHSAQSSNCINCISSQEFPMSMNFAENQALFGNLEISNLESKWLHKGKNCGNKTTNQTSWSGSTNKKLAQCSTDLKITLYNQYVSLK